MKKLLTIAAAIVGVMIGVQTANATPIQIIIRSFSGSLSGTGSNGSLGPVSGDEPWRTDCIEDDCPANGFQWGDPGVDQGLTAYDETTPATDFEITFPGLTIDSSLIVQPGAPDPCAGMGGGGTTFCTTSGDFWAGTLTSADSIAFFAPPGTSLVPGEDYFVNIFFVGAPTSTVAFTGDWTTEATPEPASLLLLGSGLAFGARFWRKSRTKA